MTVNYLDRDGPTHKAGLNGSTIDQFDEVEIRGDIITAIDGEPITTAYECLYR
jgi:S1-C subfamily serine protease